MTALELEELVRAESAKHARPRPAVVARYPRDPSYVALIESEFRAARERSADVRRASDIASINLARDGRVDMTALMSALNRDAGWCTGCSDDVAQRFQAKRKQRNAQGRGDRLRAAWKEMLGARLAVVGRVLGRLATESHRR